MDVLKERMAYVESLLSEYDLFSRSDNKKKIQYSRITHTKRVCMYASRIYENYPEKDQVDYEVLMTSVIFHDAGYSDEKSGVIAHAGISEEICREYLLSQNCGQEFVEKVCYIVKHHSDKKLLYCDEIPAEMLIMMEADLFDDTGALGVIFDTWIESWGDDVTLMNILERIRSHTNADMIENPMRTQYSIDLWNKKKQLSDEFVEQLAFDIEEFDDTRVQR